MRCSGYFHVLSDLHSLIIRIHVAPARVSVAGWAGLFPTRPRDVYDQSEQHSDEDRLQDKLPSVDVAGHDEERSVGIARKPEKTASASAVRRKHQRE
jgi:hypothetical protein